ncbi:ABC transporter ATP-binding protein [Motiliproteus sp. SC1-56]|uniref:ABC transporter ATP-binding protein n=1 Tax=Motiliproteus sp. SC1-56 TaxID=2799565 RepID=UPI001A8FB3FA|nr:ABC transporter ATP-binding protein [Motiliproteus sp. SC1-56]
MGSLLSVKGIECRYQQQAVVSDLSFAVQPGEIACLLGPSGCGKTTVLRAIAGFNAIYAGSISLEQEVIASPGNGMAPERRGIGMVFQDYALFPHLNVRDNVAFGLQKWSARERQQAVTHLLELVKLQGMENRFPHELSGGQQQRVALARALAPKPRLLLLDEPFSNLDTELRRQLAQEVRDILKEEGISAIVVTHDQDEAFTVSDKLGVLAEGRLQQWDSPFQVYHQPANRTVASFVGEGKFIRGRALEGGLVETDIGLVKAQQMSWQAGDEVDVFLRPHEIVPGCSDCDVRGRVTRKEFLGTTTLYTFTLDNERQVESTFINADFQMGETVGLRVETDNLVAFPAAS